MVAVISCALRVDILEAFLFMTNSDIQSAERLKEACGRVTKELGKVIVGQKNVVEELLIALFASGHCLLVGVPGLAKTLMIRTLAESLTLDFRRIQFTPDLMPSDITGTEVIQEDKSTGDRELRFLPGPVFANVILADEINRTPPKTQAALLEAMQEHQVTVGGEQRTVPQPFFVLATQNPIEQEGTYPLPEAQLDRFMFNIHIDYPDEAEELAIIKQTTADVTRKVTATLSADEIMELCALVRKVPIADHVAMDALRLSRMTRPKKDDAPDYIKQYVAWGAGPRASQYLVLGAKARAVLQGRYFVSREDICKVALPVLRHRIRTNFNADADGLTTDDLILRLIDSLPEAGEGADQQQLGNVFREADTTEADAAS